MASRKLTTRFVETIAVPAGQDRMSIPDAAVEGLELELRVSPNGAKTWAFRYRRTSDGARRRVTIGRFPDKSLDDARQRARELRAEVGRGADPATGAGFVVRLRPSGARRARLSMCASSRRQMSCALVLPMTGKMNRLSIDWSSLRTFGARLNSAS